MIKLTWSNVKRKEDMSSNTALSLQRDLLDKEFEGKKIRRYELTDGTEVWPVVDVIAAATESKDPAHYWRVIKSRMEKEGNQTVSNCDTLKIPAADGKLRETDVMTRPEILRMIQSIPSKKAERFKQFIAEMANERIEEIQHPSKGIKNSIRRWEAMGKSREWISRRILGIDARHGETDALKKHGITQSKDFAYFTDKTNKAVFGGTAKEEKAKRGLGQKQSLRDNASIVEVFLLGLHESTSAAAMDTTGAYGKKAIDGVYDTVSGIIGNTRQAIVDAFGQKILQKKGNAPALER